MEKWLTALFSRKNSIADYQEYKRCIKDVMDHKLAMSMENFIQHSDISCLEHCLYVSYTSFLVCKRLGLDYRSAARGGLLHDFFLYDWHITKPDEGLHGFVHPRIALRNANRNFDLNGREQDIIEKHMWPMTLVFPKYKESYIVCLIDKYCASMEIARMFNRRRVLKLKKFLMAAR